jgi:hypothetical protein
MFNREKSEKKMANPNVLTTASIIKCPHQGKLLLTGISHKLKVQGMPVLLKSDIKNALVDTSATSGTGCTNKNTSSTKQCTSVLSVTGGEATKLKVGGVPVMLNMVTGTTDGFPPSPSLLTGVTPVQNKLTAI